MKLSIEIISDEKGVYIARCPSLPGCMSKGYTKDEAKRKLDEAICGYIAAMSNCVPEKVNPEFVEV